MMNKTNDKEAIKAHVIKDMRSLGVYKPAYNTLIDVYCDLLVQYARANEQFVEGGYQYETETAAGGTKKSAIVATLENLRKDLLTYSDRLCLNPKAIQSVSVDIPKQSKLVQVLSEIS